MQPFHLETVTAGGDCAVLRMDGEIDAYAAPQIRGRVLDLARNGTIHIIADLRGAGFLDSAGLGALVGSRTGLRARGGSLALVASAGRILQTLRITGYNQAQRAMFPLYRLPILFITHEDQFVVGGWIKLVPFDHAAETISRACHHPHQFRLLDIEYRACTL